MIELSGIDAWLWARFTGDSTLGEWIGRRVYDGAAPEEDANTGQPPEYPFLIFRVLTNSDVNGLGPTARGLVRAVYRIYINGQGGGYGSIRQAANRLDELAVSETPVTLTVDGDSYTVYGSRRLRQYKERPAEDGVFYPHLGGEYEIHAPGS
jgi:hypothetical protein